MRLGKRHHRLAGGRNRHGKHAHIALIAQQIILESGKVAINKIQWHAQVSGQVTRHIGVHPGHRA